MLSNSFAAVVDTNGKLIAGKYRKKVDRRLIATTSIPDSSDQYYQTTSCYLFYGDYLVTAIRQFYFESSSTREEEKPEVNFDVININNKNKAGYYSINAVQRQIPLCISRISS